MTDKEYDKYWQLSIKFIDGTLTEDETSEYHRLGELYKPSKKRKSAALLFPTLEVPTCEV